MNVYDFDNTIYNGDSTIDFYLFCVKKHPGLIRVLPGQITGMLRSRIKKENKTKRKEAFYTFLQKLDDVDRDVVSFWNQNERKIKQWYLRQKQEDDVIISASPCFLLMEIAKRLGLRSVIASNVDKHTGVTEGLNCRDTEKVKRFNEIYHDAVIENFYSDSSSDLAMAKRSKRSFIVKGDKILSWKGISDE